MIPRLGEIAVGASYGTDIIPLRYLRASGSNTPCLQQKEVGPYQPMALHTAAWGTPMPVYSIRRQWPPCGNDDSLDAVKTYPVGLYLHRGASHLERDSDKLKAAHSSLRESSCHEDPNAQTFRAQLFHRGEALKGRWIAQNKERLVHKNQVEKEDRQMKVSVQKGRKKLHRSDVEEVGQLM